MRLLALLLLPLTAFAGSADVQTEVVIRWDKPAFNTDGTDLVVCPAQLPWPEDCLSGYRILWGLNSRGYTDSQDVNDPAALQDTITLTGPPDTLYYVAMQAFNNGGEFSSYSNEILIELVAIPTPNPPENVDGAVQAIISCPVGRTCDVRITSQ